MEKYILPEFGNPLLNRLPRRSHGGAVRTDGVYHGLLCGEAAVFPGGNIGKLAVCGTVNDLSMTGAVPRYLSMGLILEEGFPIPELQKILHTMKLAAQEAGVYIVTGDTKVVGRGAADGIFINTAGITATICCPGWTLLLPAMWCGNGCDPQRLIGDHSAGDGGSSWTGAAGASRATALPLRP